MEVYVIRVVERAGMAERAIAGTWCPQLRYLQTDDDQKHL